jgi:hypothetical protein
MTSNLTLKLAAAVAAALLVPLVAVAALRGNGDRAPSASPPSFQRDVAPVLRAKCTGCHQVGGIAPFPLETAKQAREKAPLIAAAVGARIMPPWPPGPASPDYVGEAERTLSAAERSTILRWARNGGRASGPGAGKPPLQKPDLRPGERQLDLAMPSAYRPSAKKGTTDDYRCFLLDPKLTDDASVTSARIVPGASSVVHHVILFRVDAAARAQAQELDVASRGPGWTCFGGTGVSLGGPGQNLQTALDNAPWIAAWAPGWGRGRLPDGVGVPLPKGSLVVMQVHYNLLNGGKTDRSRAVLTTVPAGAAVRPVETMLLPAPVELACTKGESGRLCKRDAALAELGRKYGGFASVVPIGLLLICGKDAANPRPSTTTSCDRRLDAAATIHVAAGHMHLLGKSIRLELNPGTPRARVLLDIPRWDFHWQNGYVLKSSVQARAGDVVRVTCTYDPSRRKRGEEGIPRTPRYVLWGEGTTDEMCLGLLQVTRP